MAVLSDKDKNEVFKKFQQRNEKQILMRQGKSVLFGDTEVTVKPLTWAKSNAFEDKAAEVFEKFSGAIVEYDNDIVGQFKYLLTFLRDDLLALAELATEGVVTLEFVEQHGASKADVIETLTESFEINYGYLKNLLALAGQFK